MMALKLELFIVWQLLTFNPMMIYSKEHRRERKIVLKDIKNRIILYKEG